ncbi:hypothetical protein GpartN1_g1237.t1 [Galdieria partita]|uniref:SET domain-containing protein n=1 Tax=Galdieria partita TaxID=83374 RepID=A0A9C7UNE9_9RHOD|nr:hypothetical protein GpartN1_g1237.t1 [Galdieria partita]
MSDGSLEKLLHQESHKQFQWPLKDALEKRLQEKLSAKQSFEEKRVQLKKCGFLCDFVISVWYEIHKLFKTDPELVEANVLRILDQSAFLMAGLLKYKNFEAFENGMSSALSMSLRGLERETLLQTASRIASSLREVGVNLHESLEHDMSAETIWEFLNTTAMTLLKELDVKKIRLGYLWDSSRVRECDSDSEANLLFYGILERRISLIRKIVEENRRKLMSHYANFSANVLYISPLKSVPEGRTIHVTFSEKFSKNISSKIITKAVVLSKIERPPYEYFTWVPLKTNYKVNDTDLRNEPISLPILEDSVQIEVYTKLLEQDSPLIDSDLFPQKSSRLNTERISLTDKLFCICYELTCFILEKTSPVSKDREFTYSSVCEETYLPLKGTVPKNLSLTAEDPAIAFIHSRLLDGSNFMNRSFQRIDSCSESFEQVQDLGAVLRKWFCRKCYTYACGEHLPMEVFLPQKFFNMAYEANNTPFLYPPCRNGCIFNVEVPSWGVSRCHDWTNEDIITLQSFLRVFGSSWCDMATVFFQKHSCYECAFFAESNSLFRKRVTKKNGQRKKNQSNRKSTVTLMDHIHCSHDDDCNSENCSCKKGELYCEKYCPCHSFTQGNCRNRAICCSCKGGKCLNGQCPCFKENRECDPDRCSCFARFRTEGMWDESKSTCKNVGIRTKAHKRLFIAPSDYHERGWGLFTTEPIEKYEFICEYKGELVSLDECERREKSYQAITDMTFVFKKGEVHIDATRKGGKARFANEPGTKALPNCYSCYKRTMGDLRVGIYADRNIQAGEEILFKYEC